jgi:hypothetical protein
MEKIMEMNFPAHVLAPLVARIERHQKEKEEGAARLAKMNLQGNVQHELGIGGGEGNGQAH